MNSVSVFVQLKVKKEISVFIMAMKCPSKLFACIVEQINMFWKYSIVTFKIFNREKYGIHCFRDLRCLY
jgi:hypothetical protein